MGGGWVGGERLRLKLNVAQLRLEAGDKLGSVEH